MPIASRPSSSPDGNLLFGVLAMQVELLDDRQACAAWATRKDTPFADVLRDLGLEEGGDE
jgi:hypothetical protein